MPFVPAVSVLPVVPAALALTLLFVPDEPRAPVVAIDVVEDTDGRTADVVVFPAAADPAPPTPTAVAVRPLVAHLASPPVDGSTRLRTLPIAPEGCAVTDVVDGVLVTFDDVGAWVPPPPPPAVVVGPAKKGPPSPPPPASSLSSPPSLPVASVRALRLFVPTVVAGRAVGASLHGVGADGAPQIFAGQAVVVTRARPTLALSAADVLAGKVVVHAFDDSVPAVMGTWADACSGPVAAGMRALQRATHLDVDAVVCSGRLVIGAGRGIRIADRPDRDRSARGLVVVRR